MDDREKRIQDAVDAGTEYGTLHNTLVNYDVSEEHATAIVLGHMQLISHMGAAAVNAQAIQGISSDPTISLLNFLRKKKEDREDKDG